MKKEKDMGRKEKNRAGNAAIRRWALRR